MHPKRILLADDSRQDVEMTLNALSMRHISNSVDVARDGAEALDYLFRRGAWAVRDLGLFWVLLNCPPPQRGEAGR